MGERFQRLSLHILQNINKRKFSEENTKKEMVLVIQDENLSKKWVETGKYWEISWEKNYRVARYSYKRIYCLIYISFLTLLTYFIYMHEFNFISYSSSCNVARKSNVASGRVNRPKAGHVCRICDDGKVQCLKDCPKFAVYEWSFGW